MDELELEQAMEVCESRIYRVYIAILKPEFRGLAKQFLIPAAYEQRVLAQDALFDDVRSLIMRHTGLSLDVGDVINLASTGELARTISFGVIFAEAVEQPKTLGCGEDFAGYAPLTLIASYWLQRAFSIDGLNPTVTEKRAEMVQRANELDKMAFAALDAMPAPELRKAESELYTALYKRWRDAGKTDAAIFEILKGCGQYV